MDIMSRTEGNFPKTETHEGKEPGVEGVFSQFFSIVTGRGLGVSGQMLKSKPEEVVKTWIITFSKH
jgi:hypothetical protein